MRVALFKIKIFFFSLFGAVSERDKYACKAINAEECDEDRKEIALEEKEKFPPKVFKKRMKDLYAVHECWEDESG